MWLNAYQSATSPSKLRGQFYTPSGLVDLIFRSLDLTPEHRVVEPRVGMALFFAARWRSFHGGCCTDLYQTRTVPDRNLSGFTCAHRAAGERYSPPKSARLFNPVKAFKFLLLLGALMAVVYLCVEHPNAVRRRLHREMVTRYHLPPGARILSAEQENPLLTIDRRRAVTFRLPATRKPAAWLEELARHSNLLDSRENEHEYWRRGDYGIRIAYDPATETYEIWDGRLGD